MKTRNAVTLMTALSLVAVASADDSGGPAVGDGAPTFDVDDVTGPHKGETLCYV